MADPRPGAAARRPLPGGAEGTVPGWTALQVQRNGGVVAPKRTRGSGRMASRHADRGPRHQLPVADGGLALRPARRGGRPGRASAHTRRTPGAAEALGPGRCSSGAQAASPRAPQLPSPGGQARRGRASLRPVRVSAHLRPRSPGRSGRVCETATGHGRALVARPGPLRRCGRSLHRLLPDRRSPTGPPLGQGDLAGHRRAGAGCRAFGAPHPVGVPRIPARPGPVRADSEDR